MLSFVELSSSQRFKMTSPMGKILGRVSFTKRLSLYRSTIGIFGGSKLFVFLPLFGGSMFRGSTVFVPLRLLTLAMLRNRMSSPLSLAYLVWFRVSKEALMKAELISHTNKKAPITTAC